MSCTRSYRQSWQNGAVAGFLVAGFSWPAAAQHFQPASSLTTPSSDSLAQVAREDTVYAVQRYFFAQRHRYTVYSLVAVPGVVFTGIRAASVYQQPEFSVAKVNVGLFATAFAVFLGRSLLLAYHYREGRERKVLAIVEAGQPLPYKIRRKLTTTYFGVRATTNWSQGQANCLLSKAAPLGVVGNSESLL